MKREIKFRAWDGKQFSYWGFGIMPGAFKGPPTNQDGNPMTMIHQQFTGLKDKNGKEIYDGDIVMVRSQYDEEDGVPANIASPNRVYFRDGAFRCGFFDMLLGEKVCSGSEGNWNMEVIGNIYENPELLKAKP